MKSVVGSFDYNHAMTYTVWYLLSTIDLYSSG